MLPHNIDPFKVNVIRCAIWYHLRNLKNVKEAGGRYHIETSPLICSANQWTGFYMITATVIKELQYINIDHIDPFRVN